AGYALKFTNTNGSYVDLGDILDSVAFPCTIEAWINLGPEASHQETIFSSDNSSSVYSGIWVVVGGSAVEADFGDGGVTASQDVRGYFTKTGLGSGWVHVAVVCPGPKNFLFYFDGILQPSTFIN